jgi:hypothetical protein
MKKFSPEVVSKIKYYVYRLIDPRNGNTFYVGKGKGNRVFAHVNDELACKSHEQEMSEKLGTIRQIRSKGLEVIHVIHRHGLDSKTALEVEAALIDAYPGLTNEIGGNRSDYAPANAQEIEQRYNAEIIKEISEKCIIIKITQHFIDLRGGVYEATRKAWRVRKSRVKKADYVLSVLNGLVVGVFTDLDWREDNIRPDRFSFIGNPAPKNIQKKYIGKIIPLEYTQRGSANPCQYVNC